MIFSSEFFCHAGFCSSDHTEFSRRFPAEAITQGFSRRRPVRSMQIPPGSGICPTDFTDIHRFFSSGVFIGVFCHADFADDADFFIHRITRNLVRGFLLRRLLTDWRGSDLFGRYRYPLRVEYVPLIYTDVHRSFAGGFGHADFANDADFLSHKDLC